MCSGQSQESCWPLDLLGQVCVGESQWGRRLRSRVTTSRKKNGNPGARSEPRAPAPQAAAPAHLCRASSGNMSNWQGLRGQRAQAGLAPQPTPTPRVSSFWAQAWSWRLGTTVKWHGAPLRGDEKFLESVLMVGRPCGHANKHRIVHSKG